LNFVLKYGTGPPGFGVSHAVTWRRTSCRDFGEEEGGGRKGVEIWENAQYGFGDPNGFLVLFCHQKRTSRAAETSDYHTTNINCKKLPLDPSGKKEAFFKNKKKKRQTLVMVTSERER